MTKEMMVFVVALCATASGCSDPVRVPTDPFPVGGVTGTGGEFVPDPEPETEGGFPQLVIDQAGRTYARNVCVTFSERADVTTAEWYAVKVYAKTASTDAHSLRIVRVNKAPSWALLDTNCAGGLPLKGTDDGAVTYELLVNGMVDSRSVSSGSGWVTIVPDSTVVKKSGGGGNTSWIATSGSRCVVEHQGHCFDPRSQTCDGGTIVPWTINGNFNCPGAQKCCVGKTIADTGASATPSAPNTAPELRSRNTSPVSPPATGGNPPRPEPIPGKTTRINAVSK